MTQHVSESRFYMWRALFALAHVDHNVSRQEVRFMAEALEDEPFTPDQLVTLKSDTVQKQDAISMFKNITEVIDQADFFKLARNLVWVDGDFGSEEKTAMLELQRIYVQLVDLNKLIPFVQLEFAKEDKPEQVSARPKKKGVMGVIDSLMEQLALERGER